MKLILTVLSILIFPVYASAYSTWDSYHVETTGTAFYSFTTYGNGATSFGTGRVTTDKSVYAPGEQIKVMGFVDGYLSSQIANYAMGVVSISQTLISYDVNSSVWALPNGTVNPLNGTGIIYTTTAPTAPGTYYIQTLHLLYNQWWTGAGPVIGLAETQTSFTVGPTPPPVDDGSLTSADSSYIVTIDNPVAANTAPSAPSITGPIVSRFDGWDGWIELTGTNHTVSYNYSTSASTPSAITGYAWGGQVVGWLLLNLFATSTPADVPTQPVATGTAGIPSCYDNTNPVTTIFRISNPDSNVNYYFDIRDAGVSYSAAYPTGGLPIMAGGTPSGSSWSATTLVSPPQVTVQWNSSGIRYFHVWAVNKGDSKKYSPASTEVMVNVKDCPGTGPGGAVLRITATPQVRYKAETDTSEDADFKIVKVLKGTKFDLTGSVDVKQFDKGAITEMSSDDKNPATGIVTTIVNGTQKGILQNTGVVMYTLSSYKNNTRVQAQIQVQLVDPNIIER